jgi:excisionase family DNA binding protein
MATYVSPRHLLEEIRELKKSFSIFTDRPLGKKEAAKQLGCSLRTLDRKIKEGFISFTVAADGSRYIFQSDLNRYAKGITKESL